MKMTGEAQIKTIGLWGIVFTIVGFVVGISIFILPAELIIIAGPGVILAYAVAGAMAVVNCFATAQIGTLMPAEGGTFIALSKLLSPFMGFLAVWILLAAVVLVNAFVSYGFADYLVYFIPGLDKTLVAVCVLIFFGLVNVLGSTLVVKFQSIMVIILIIMLSIFILSGVPYFEADNLSPFLPRGLPSVFQAATLGYFSFAGFISLLEFGGEIKNPIRNIPLGLGISFVIVLGAYGGISLILSGVNSPIDYNAVMTPVLEVAKIFLPDWIIDALVLSIIAAAATTVNGLILGYSRDIFVIAEAGLFPKFLAKRSKKYAIPANAIIAYTTISVIAVLMGSSIEQYALVAVLGLLLQQIFLAVSLYRIPAVMGDDYENADFKLPMALLYGIAVLLFIISIGLIAMTVNNAPIFGVFIMGVLSAGSMYYYIVNKYFISKIKE